ncbi:hypothetical protein ABPG72_007616 [Tetrahymena utriculariae]
MNKDLIRIIVTGSNKGVGYGIIENLAAKPYHIIMACRSLERANETRSKLLQTHPQAKIDSYELNVDSTDSINKFVQQIHQHYGHVDILLNNSGMAFKGDEFGTHVVEQTFRTNFYGTIDLTEKMLPYIKESGKVIFVGSSAGKYNNVKNNQTILQQLKNPHLTKEQLFAVAKQFYEDVKDNTYAQKGWAKSAYGMSKLCINLYASVLSRFDSVIQKKLQVYTCCPGWVRTDMAGQQATRSIQEGAVCPVYLVELPFQVKPELQGKFFYDQVVTPL